MRIQNNVPALNAHRFYGVNQTGLTKSIGKLSSGYRINSAADDAAGLAISEKMRSQIRGLTMASKNAQDGISLIQTAEGGMQEIDNMLQRIRELVVYASNDTQEQNALGTSDRQKIQDEIHQLAKEIDSMSSRVEFNKKVLLDGSQEAAPTNGAVVTALQAAKVSLADNQEAYGNAAAELAVAKESLSKARDAVGGILNDPEVDAALKDLLLGGAATEAGGVLSALASLKLGSVLGAVEKIADITTTAGSYGSAHAALVSAVAVLATVAASSLTNDDKIAIAKVVNALGSSAAAGALGAATSAWSGAYGTVDTAAGSLVTASSNLEAAKAGFVSAQAAYDAAEKTPALYFQIGANANQGIEVSIGSMDTKKLGIGNGDGSGATISVLGLSGRNINPILDKLDTALSYVTSERSKLGAIQNRLEYTQSSLDISAENLTNAESRIRDVDMAKEMSSFTRMNILFQASTAMLAQANALPQGVLQMLG
jgi:flagellin